MKKDDTITDKGNAKSDCVEEGVDDEITEVTDFWTHLWTTARPASTHQGHEEDPRRPQSRIVVVSS
jgi:hypothetical protein